jgi:hypothetical protein
MSRVQHEALCDLEDLSIKKQNKTNYLASWIDRLKDLKPTLKGLFFS